MKLKNWQKTEYWKHLGRTKHLSLPYMIKKNKFIPTKQRKTWDVKKYARVINEIIRKSDATESFPFSHRGERVGTLTRGVSFNYRNMTYRIWGTGNGVKKAA